MPMANFGHRSRTSKRKGIPFRRASAQAVIPWKMGGEVPQTTSTFFTRMPFQKEETMNVIKKRKRWRKDLCSAR